MSRLARRPRADHQHAAQQARQMPRQWVLAGSYNSTQSASGAAFLIRTADHDRMPPYRPAGAFQTRTELTEDGADLYVRYIGEDGSS